MSSFTDREYEFCKKAIKKLQDHPLAYVFLVPVNTDITPGYLDVIKHPMDLGTIENKLATNKYHSAKEFVADVNLVWENAIQFNSDRKDNVIVLEMAKELRAKCRRMFEDKIIPRNEVDEWTRKMQCLNCKMKKLLSAGVTEESMVPMNPSAYIV